MGIDDVDEDRVYRALIDRLVRDCREGQGHIGASRALSGVWNANAGPNQLPERHEVNVLLAPIPKADREVLAHLLREEFVSGVHASLVALHEAEIAPFDKAYEGTPFHDFVGRLDNWEWPNGPRS